MRYVKSLRYPHSQRSSEDKCYKKKKEEAVMKKIIDWAIAKPKSVMVLTVIAVLLTASQFIKIKVDTDPENMLPQDAPVRVFHREMKKEFGMYDMIVIGIVDTQHENGVFNKERGDAFVSINKVGV